MVVEFYWSDISPPSHTALMVLVALDVEHELKLVDLFEGEQKQPGFLKINPQGLVPALKDGDLCIAESRAISTYLCDVFGGDSEQGFYPKDRKTRAKVDQLLFASMKTDEDINAYIDFVGVMFHGATGPNEAKLPGVHMQLELCERFLNENLFIAANHLTVADLFMACPFHGILTTGFDDFGKYPKTAAWLKKIRDLPYFDRCNKEGLEKITQMYKTKVAENLSKN